MSFDECALNRDFCLYNLAMCGKILLMMAWCVITLYYHLRRTRKKASARTFRNYLYFWEKRTVKEIHWGRYVCAIIFSFCAFIVIFGIISEMLHARYIFLKRGVGLTDEQRALWASNCADYEFLWEREIAVNRRLEEDLRRSQELVNKILTVLHNESIGMSRDKILYQGPNQQNQTADELAEPKIAALRAGEETSFSTGAEEIVDNSMERFQQLVGYKVQYYISQKSSTFNITGNLNFWEYFQLQSQYRDLSHLRRSTPLEDDKTVEDVFFLSDTNPVRLSADNEFLLYDSLIDGPDFKQLTHSHKVTIVTQTSMDRLFTFIESYEHWTGPISAAVFLNGPLEYFLFRSYVSYLKRCHPQHYRQTRFSVATPIKNPIPRNILIESEIFEKFNCKSKSDDINVVFKKELYETNVWLQVKYYPQNMMRNLAKANIKTDYHLTLDVDIVPCVGMSEKLNKFLNESFIASALVIPTYEISRKISFPQTKRELVSLTKRKLAQPFHKDVFATNQNATNFPKWEKVHDSFEDVHVVHEVELFPIFYEPFIVELQSNPLYDETFVGYGFTRSSHAFEVFVRNGKFLVLSPIFTAELGLKKVKDWSTFRQQQNESNRKRFNYFIANITSRFPDVQRVENDPNTSYYLHNSSNYNTFA